MENSWSAFMQSTSPIPTWDERFTSESHTRTTTESVEDHHAKPVLSLDCDMVAAQSQPQTQLCEPAQQRYLRQLQLRCQQLQLPPQQLYPSPNQLALVQHDSMFTNAQGNIALFQESESQPLIDDWLETTCLEAMDSPLLTTREVTASLARIFSESLHNTPMSSCRHFPQPPDPGREAARQEMRTLCESMLAGRREEDRAIASRRDREDKIMAIATRALGMDYGKMR